MTMIESTFVIHDPLLMLIPDINTEWSLLTHYYYWGYEGQLVTPSHCCSIRMSPI